MIFRVIIGNHLLSSAPRRTYELGTIYVFNLAASLTAGTADPRMTAGTADPRTGVRPVSPATSSPT